MNIKTIITVDGVNVVDFGSAASRFYWIENLGSTTVYVSGNENIVPDGDNVKVLSAGCGTMIESLGGKIYILGAGKFQITNQGDKFPPFRNAPVADGGVMASGNPVVMDGLQGGVPFSEIVVSGKNLFGDVMNYYLAGNQQDGFVFAPSSGKSFCFLGIIKNNTDYTVTNYSDGNRFKIVLFKNYPDNAAPEECLDILPTEPNTVTFNSGEYNYCVLSVAYNDANITIKKAQLELGDTATEYEPPITGRELTVNVNGNDITITPDINPYVIPNDIRQQEGLNVVTASAGTLEVVGVRKNAAVKKIWDKLDELTTAIIVSNGETIE